MAELYILLSHKSLNLVIEMVVDWARKVGKVHGRHLLLMQKQEILIFPSKGENVHTCKKQSNVKYF